MHLQAPRPEPRASVAPMPCSIGSPLASTHVLAASGRASSSTSESIGEGHGRRSAGVSGSSVELALRADDHLGGKHRGTRGLAEARPAVRADTDDDERRRAHAGSRAAAASRLAICGNAAQCTCRKLACRPPATKPSSRSLPRAASFQAARSPPCSGSTCE